MRGPVILVAAPALHPGANYGLMLPGGSKTISSLFSPLQYLKKKKKAHFSFPHVQLSTSCPNLLVLFVYILQLIGFQHFKSLISAMACFPYFIIFTVEMQPFGLEIGNS